MNGMSRLHEGCSLLSTSLREDPEPWLPSLHGILLTLGDPFPFQGEELGSRSQCSTPDLFSCVSHNLEGMEQPNKVLRQ